MLSYLGVSLPKLEVIIGPKFYVVNLRRLLTSDVIDGVESDAKLSNLHRVLFLATPLQVLNPLPVIVLKLSIVVGQKGGTLEPSKPLVHQRLSAMLSAVKVETYRPGTSIVCILDDFLRGANDLVRCAVVSCTA